MRPARRRSSGPSWRPRPAACAAPGRRPADGSGVHRPLPRARARAGPQAQGLGRRAVGRAASGAVAAGAASGAPRRRARRRGVRPACGGQPSASAALRAASSASFCAASSASRRASSSAALRASSSRRRASSAADRIEIVSCSRRSASRFAASRCCSTSARCRAASSVAVRARRRRGVAPRPPGDGRACSRRRCSGRGQAWGGAARRRAGRCRCRRASSAPRPARPSTGRG